MTKAGIWLILLIMLISSALAVIYSKYHSRMLFSEIQNQKRILDDQEEKWGQLQLELTTLTEHSRIEQMARTKLKMDDPAREKIIYIKP